MNKVISLIIHIIIVAAAVYSLKYIPQMPSRYLPLLEILPFILAGISLILGYRFNRSLVIYSVLIYTMIYLYLNYFPLNTQAEHHLMLNTITILLAVNITIISHYRERGIITIIGISRILFIFLQVGLLMALVKYPQAEWSTFINQLVIPEIQIQWTFFTQPALLVVFLSILVFSAYFLVWSNSFRNSIFIAMFLVILAISIPAKGQYSIAVLISYSILLILFTLISDSYRMAFIDELTDLPGRRALNEDLNKLGSQYVIAMLDVDHFKKFNDTYGHDAGDDVLRLLGSRLKKVTGGGKPFRYGGEEFTILFPGALIDDVEQHLENLRLSVANKKFALRKQERRHKNSNAKSNSSQREVEVTISIGYAEPSGSASSAEQVIKSADKALYRAKKKGRNCISS